MRAFGWFIITLLLGACSADKPSKKCIYPAGELFFSKEKGGWSEVYIGKERSDTVLVYNPTKTGIRLEGFNHFRRSLVGRSDTLNRIGVWEDIPWHPELVTR